MGDIENNIRVVRERIARAAEQAGREAQSVRLVAVTKTVPVARISEAIEVGLSEFGENRVQEAAEKFALHITEPGDAVNQGKIARDSITLHFIGSLQRNKARHASALFDCIQSVDGVELVEALDRGYTVPPGGQKLPILLQVNVTGEASKSGVPPAGLNALADAVSGSNNLRGVGLMTIARLGANESELRDTFATLRSLLDGLRRNHAGDWTELSMGMSDDYEIAVEEGATIIRLGRALFGIRNA